MRFECTAGRAVRIDVKSQLAGKLRLERLIQN